MAKRNLSEVIGQLLVVIPEDETAIRAELEKCRESAIFSAPEAMSRVWQRTSEALNSTIGKRSPTEWIRQSVRIFNGIE